jgi:hypothetical protein
MVLQLGLQAVQQFGVDGRAHFAAQDLLGALDGESGDLVAQGVARLGGFLLRLGLRLGDDLRGFVGRLGLGFLDDLQRQAFGSGKTASLRAAPSSASMRLLALASSLRALSAADRPSATLRARSSSAAAMGGQMYFIVTPTKIRRTMIWMIRVAVMLTLLPRKPLSECGAPFPLQRKRSRRRPQCSANYFAICAS